MGKVVAVCVSKEKGTRKTNVGAAKLLRDWGIENDAHGLMEIILTYQLHHYRKSQNLIMPLFITNLPYAPRRS